LLQRAARTPASGAVQVGLRMLTVTVPETLIESTVARGLLASDDVAQP